MVYSAGRDRRVWATDIKNPEYRALVCEEKEPVLKVGFVLSLWCELIMLGEKVV